MQNEIISIIANAITKVILPAKCMFFSIIVDETMDISKHEQVSLCVRYVDQNLNIQEY